jgi:hypothetical protein
LFLLIPIYSFSLLFTLFYSYFLFAEYFIEGAPKRGANGVFTAPEQAPQLMTDESMNQAFGTSSEEDEGEEVDELETDGGHQDGAVQDGGQQHNYMFLFLVNFYSQLD